MKRADETHEEYEFRSGERGKYAERLADGYSITVHRDRADQDVGTPRRDPQGPNEPPEPEPPDGASGQERAPDE